MCYDKGVRLPEVYVVFVLFYLGLGHGVVWQVFAELPGTGGCVESLESASCRLLPLEESTIFWSISADTSLWVSGPNGLSSLSSLQPNTKTYYRTISIYVYIHNTDVIHYIHHIPIYIIRYIYHIHVPTCMYIIQYIHCYLFTCI